MNNEIQKFDFKGAALRTLTDEAGEPWFVLKDCMSILDLGNPTETVKMFDKDEFSTTEVIDSIGRRQQTYIISEPGLYRLVMKSRKPEAKEFQRWVTHEVLPSIRTSSSTHLSAMVCKARTAAASNLLVEPANVLKFRRCPSRASSENDSHKAFQIPGICDFAMSRRFTPRAISVSSVLSVLHMAVYAGSTSFRNPSGCCSTSKNCSRYSAAFDIDSSPNCSARTSHMRDDTDFRRGLGGSPNAARHHTRKGGA